MGHAEKLHQNRSRAGQEAHAPFYVQYEVIENYFRQKTFQQSEHADARVFTDMIKGEIEKVNSHVVACLGVLESASPVSDTELVRCSAECGSLVAFIHCNGKGCVRSSRSSRRRRRCAVRTGSAAHASACA